MLNRFFDCFRIDHILGFFRIWEIPLEFTEGLCGHFRPAAPLSEEEIGNYGIRFKNRWTKPCIHTRFLPDVFGENTGNDLYRYLCNIDAEHLILNEFCSTQRKITRLFEGSNDNKSQSIRDGLMYIANEILFLEDPYRAKCYHPRIAAYKSYAYRELSGENRRAFDRLYHDFYFLRHNSFWKETALKRLIPLINSTDMLVCGEDLGMIPASVHEVMNKRQIFTLEIERMPKTLNTEFTDLHTLPYHSVCTTSTHDITPIRAWWKEDRGKTQRYYNIVLQRNGKAPEECSTEIAEQMIINHLHASSMLTVIPLQDWFAVDEEIKSRNPEAERINTPANPNNYWRYRMHITLETLLHATNFNRKIRTLITESKR
jgi:4-alpha-glucanotransferase